MVSKIIDSHSDLGINSPGFARIQVEKSTTCAPLRTVGHAEAVLVTNETSLELLAMPGDQLALFYYGPKNTTNVTYSYNTHTALDRVSYTLEYEMFQSGPLKDEDRTWTPLPAYSSNDSDVILLFIAGNSVTYREPNSDIIFSANEPGQITINGLVQDYYAPDRYVNVMGCKEQYRVCNAINGRCTRKAGFGFLDQVLKSDADGLKLSTLQFATALRTVLALQQTSIYHVVSTRLAGALRVTETLQGRQQVGLPDTQWQIEASNFFENGLARLQQQTQEYATGPPTTPRGSIVLHPTEDVIDIPWKAMCFSQLVNDTTDSMSFSILGMIILFGIGIFIILFSFVQDTIVGFIQTRFKTGLHAWAEWQVTDRLVMHKLLFESHDLGQWEDGWFKSVPVTQNSDPHTGLAEKHLKYTNVREESEAGAQMIEEHFDTKKDHRY